MLISRVSEEGAGEGRVPRDDNSHEYETAAEIFEIIAKNHTLGPDNDPITNSDLVILYKNIDLGPRLMPSQRDSKSPTRSNQRVETIVHSGEDSDMSELDDVISSNDLPAADVFLINKERIDLLNNPPSLENTLCHKFGDLEIKMSNLGTDILFKSTTVKEQLDNLKLMSSSSDLHRNVLPSSLLDYICCKRLEDNYTFYMENIIRYVKHTIDQLKRISNGDYLTEKAKEKWREITQETTEADSNKKIMATSASIPLHVERKRTGRTTTWDDIVHSEMDIRSLSKILEKKIFLEVPKIICGSYRLFSKQCSDNLIISCEKKARSKKVAKKDSRVDVVFKLKRSRSGHVMSNINSIMILQRQPSLTHRSIIALPVSESKEKIPESQKIVELNEEINKINKNTDYGVTTEHEEEEVTSSPTRNPSDDCSPIEKSDTSIPLRDVYNVRCGNYNHYQEAAFNTVPDELALSIQRLDIQSSLNEESVEDFHDCPVPQKKSPARVRIKSPYENKSHLIDEKKRKKLLEIRERREKKKMALSESCKIMKHKHGKGTLTPQASSSVTKLSITNKSFYNSIYGQSAPIENKQNYKRRGRRDDLEGEGLYHGETDASFQSNSIVDNSKKYTNKTYYLDDTETEMMYMQMKREEGRLSASTSSGITTELAANLSILSQQFMPSVVNFQDNKDTSSPDASIYTEEVEKSEKSFSPSRSKSPSLNRSEKSPSPIRSEKCPSPIPCCDEDSMEHIITANKSDHDVVPTNSPNRCSPGPKQSASNASTVECRKSIEKLYDLLKKVGTLNTVEKKSFKMCSPGSNTAEPTTFRESSDVQGSDSGTSLKHHLTSSETSGFSFNKANNNASTSYEVIPQMQNRSTGEETNVVPKVIISTKCQTAKPEMDKRKKDKKVCFVAPKVIPDNPLKAISQLLHEFDNAQKNRRKSAEERPARPKKYENNAGGDRVVRQGPVRGRSRLDQHLKTVEPVPPKYIANARDRRQPGQPAVTDTARQPQDKFYERVNRKKMSEIIDEAKEARGEAVRGPPKNSRLNTLAQPKKWYVQAHSEEYQNKYGRNLMADRLQRLAASSPSAEKHASFPRAKQRRPGNEVVSAVSVKPAPPAPPIDSPGKVRRSTSSSPARKWSLDRRGPDAAKRPPELQESLKEKMVAVESYVKNHYGRTGCNSPGEQRVPKKSRVPLLPCGIEISSTSSPPNEESTTIGSQLHNIIDTMIKSKTPALSPLSEGFEERNTNEVWVEEDLSKNEDRLLPLDSDLCDIFKDNIHTAVEAYQGKNENENQENTEDIQVKPDVRQYSSSTELERLENALYRQMSIGNFQKRLRLKNLTITPKQSTQHVVVVQSGDDGSVMLKTSVSQDFELKNCSFTNMSELKNSIPVLTNFSMPWRRSPIPMQISTIGYAFPQYNPSNPRILKSADESKEDKKRVMRSDQTKSNKSCLTKDYTCQTFKGQLSNQALQFRSETRGTSCDDGKSTLGKDILISTLLSNPEKSMKNKINDKCNDDTIDKEKKVTKTLPAENKGKKNPKVEEYKPDDIEYSTSLDMLVGLLNEIQNITQAQVLNLTENSQCGQLETILNNAATLENCIKNYPEELVTISALDKTRMLDSSPSSYSFYITKSEERTLTDNPIDVSNELKNQSFVPKNITATYVDKGVSVDVSDVQYRNTFTDVPSSIFPFPITINTSTSVSNSLMGVFSEPSSQSMFSCNDILYCDNLAHSQNTILEITDNSDHIIVVNESTAKIDKMPKFNVEPLVRVVEEVESVGTKKSKRVKKMNFSAKEQELDPLLKFKRDILVTVYSVLVLTVFAALSFPDLLYRT